MSNPAGSVKLWTKNDVIVSVFQQVVGDDKYHNRWIQDEDLVNAIRADFKMDDTFEFTSDDLNKAVIKDKVYTAAGSFWDQHKTSNQFNFFKRWYRPSVTSKPGPTIERSDSAALDPRASADGGDKLHAGVVTIEKKKKKVVARPKRWLVVLFYIRAWDST
jgi:hypothetical protein